MVELQEILKQLGISYKLKHRLLSHQQRVIHAIQNCRTAALGGHMDKCNECDFTRISYNSVVTAIALNVKQSIRNVGLKLEKMTY